MSLTARFRSLTDHDTLPGYSKNTVPFQHTYIPIEIVPYILRYWQPTATMYKISPTRYVIHAYPADAGGESTPRSSTQTVKHTPSALACCVIFVHS